MIDFRVCNLYPEVSDNELLEGIEDKNKVECRIEAFLEDLTVVEEKIYLYQDVDSCEYIVFEVSQMDLDVETYEVRIISMNVPLETFDCDGGALTLCAEVNHLRTDEIRYTTW